MADDGLRNLLRAVKAAAGYDPNDPALLPHSLRHAYAARLLRKHADLPDIKAALGHSQMATTWKYLRSLQGDAEKAAQKAALESPPETRETKKPAAWRRRQHRRE